MNNAECRKPRVLVVDDAPDNLFLMAALLEDDYEVATAASGPEALELVRGDDAPDLILLDVMMPGMDGYGVVRHLRADVRTAAIPVIFLTALGGVDVDGPDYLAKPITPELVLERVQARLH